MQDPYRSRPEQPQTPQSQPTQPQAPYSQQGQSQVPGQAQGPWQQRSYQSAQYGAGQAQQPQGQAPQGQVNHGQTNQGQQPRYQGAGQSQPGQAQTPRHQSPSHSQQYGVGQSQPAPQQYNPGHPPQHGAGQYRVAQSEASQLPSQQAGLSPQQAGQYGASQYAAGHHQAGHHQAGQNGSGQYASEQVSQNAAQQWPAQSEASQQQAQQAGLSAQQASQQDYAQQDFAQQDFAQQSPSQQNSAQSEPYQYIPAYQETAPTQQFPTPGGYSYEEPSYYSDMPPADQYDSYAEDEEATGKKSKKSKKAKKPNATQVCGEILLTLGVLVFLFAFYEAYWTNIASGRLQAGADEDLQAAWSQNERQNLTPELGEAFSRIYIPAFGTDFHFAIVEGTEDADLLIGPGHYVETQMPGEAGNFAVAGHRVGKGAPFNDLGSLKTCDALVVETHDAWNVYRVMPIDPANPDDARAQASACLSASQAERIATGDYSNISGRYITTPADVSTIGARPGETSTEATPDMEAVITLTTCHPQFSNAERMIVHGMLQETILKTDDARPAVLEES